MSLKYYFNQMRNKQNAYEQLKFKSRNTSNLNFKSLIKQEEIYWLGAAIPAILFAGLIDGGVSIAFAYGARKLYEINNN